MFPLVRQRFNERHGPSDLEGHNFNFSVAIILLRHIWRPGACGSKFMTCREHFETLGAPGGDRPSGELDCSWPVSVPLQDLLALPAQKYVFKMCIYYMDGKVPSLGAANSQELTIKLNQFACKTYIV